MPFNKATTMMPVFPARSAVGFSSYVPGEVCAGARGHS
jgi:hypothetical protein